MASSISRTNCWAGALGGVREGRPSPGLKGVGGLRIVLSLYTPWGHAGLGRYLMYAHICTFIDIHTYIYIYIYVYVYHLFLLLTYDVF